MRYSLFIPFLFILFSCNSKKKKHKINKEDMVQVDGQNKAYPYTIIFEQREDAKEGDYPSERTPPDIGHLYYMDNFQLNNFLPNDKEGGDTLNLEVNRKNLLIDLTYFQTGRFPFLIEANDTLIVKYQKGVPIVKVSENKEHRKYDFAYDSLRMAYFKDTKIDDDELRHTTKDYQVFIRQKKELYKKESKLLDSLYANNLLSKPYYEILKERSRYNYLNLLVSSTIQNNFNTQSTSYKVKDLNKEEIHQSDLNKDELLEFTFYYGFLVRYMYFVLNKNKGFKHENGFTQDSRNAFDAVVKDPLITNEKVKDYLLKFALGEIYQYFSKEDFEDYFSKFKENVSDSSLVTNFEEKFMLNHKKHENAKEVYLATSNQEEISLNEILYKNRGKLVYVDFWASWCAPCIAEMPASKQLQKDYKDKNIVFKYISIDQDVEKWKKASNNLKIGAVDQDLIALNYPTASFYKDKNLKSIPRYILFDKNGEILYKNAPSPSDERIREVIDQHLKRN